MYCAIIGDIVESKKIKNREETQEKLKLLLDQLSKKYDQEIASKFTITLGDEFQGLLVSPKFIIEIIDEIKAKMYPVEFRFGIGMGDILTPVNKELAIGSDGPAYHIARDCINSIKDSDSKYEQVKQDIRIGSNQPDQLNSLNLINASFAQCYFTQKNWTDKQREVVTLLMKKEVSQRVLAKELGLTQSSINRRLNTSGYLVYNHLKICLKELIIELWEDITHE